jgi:hypothetical protein
VSRFHDDDAGQKRVRDLVLGPGFYGPFSREGRYVYIDKGRLALTLQKQFAFDTVMQRHNGDAACIEEKIVRWPGYAYSAISLETRSCTIPGYESDGWMVYGKADLLHWVMCQENGNVLSLVIDFPKLQEAFWPAVKSFKETRTQQSNRTACRLVPLTWIEAQGIGIFRRMIHASPEGAAAVIAYNGTHYKNPRRTNAALQQEMFASPAVG